MANTKTVKVEGKSYVVPTDATPDEIDEISGGKSASTYGPPNPFEHETPGASQIESVSAAPAPSTFDRAKSWFTGKPAYDGTLNSPGTSPARKAADMGEGALVGASLAIPAEPALAGGIAGTATLAHQQLEHGPHIPTKGDVGDAVWNGGMTYLGGKALSMLPGFVREGIPNTVGRTFRDETGNLKYLPDFMDNFIPAHPDTARLAADKAVSEGLASRGGSSYLTKKGSAPGTGEPPELGVTGRKGPLKIKSTPQDGATIGETPVQDVDYKTNQRLNKKSDFTPNRSIGAPETGRSGTSFTKDKISSVPEPPVETAPVSKPYGGGSKDRPGFTRNRGLGTPETGRSGTGSGPSSSSGTTGAAIKTTRIGSAGDLTQWTENDLWTGYMKNRGAPLGESISKELQRRGLAKSTSSSIR